MKVFLVVIAGVTVTLLSIQLYTTMATETQAYKVIRTGKDFEIRFYPQATMATITTVAANYSALGNSGFRKLAGYIFGGNSGKQKIAMTSPVHMHVHDSASTMSFVMPAEFNKDSLPLPNDSTVSIETTSDEYVAAIRFGGFANEKRIREYTAKLEEALKANAIPYQGFFRLLAYNPPYQLFGRRNEIIVRTEQNLKD
jgi:hypothetical protein